MVSPDIVKDFAPGGTLRVAINFGNMVLVQGEPGKSEPRGVSPDLARELARRLNAPIEFVGFDSAGKAFEAIKSARCDVGFLAIEPARAAEIDFTAPYVIIEGTYLVRKDSPLQSVADVDRPGLRIGVNAKSAYDLFLTRTLKHAQLVRSADGVKSFRDEKLDAAGGIRQALMAYARTDPTVRVMNGRFMEVRQAMTMPKGRAKAFAYLRRFVEAMKASGFVAEALTRSGQAEATVAPAEQ
jgi:polar amino acid transport system substrate-binding protein